MAVVYGSALLVVLLHIELNVLGGTMFQEVQAAEWRGEGEESQSHTSDIQKRYLETVHYLIEKGVLVRTPSVLQQAADVVYSLLSSHSGLPLLFPMIQSSVEAVVAPVKLKDQHRMQDFSDLLQHIHRDLCTQMRHTNLG